MGPGRIWGHFWGGGGGEGRGGGVWVGGWVVQYSHISTTSFPKVDVGLEPSEYVKRKRLLGFLSRFVDLACPCA